MKLRLRALVFSCLALSATVPSLSAQTWRSTLYPANWTPGYAVGGDFLHDFSYAGYHRGEAPIPTPTANIIDASLPPYSADKTGANDSTVQIQQAIDDAGAAGGGVVYLPAGSYKVAPIGTNGYALRINKDNVVLRGAGTGQTFIHNTSSVMRGKQVIDVRPAQAAWWYSDSQWVVKSPITQDLLTPTKVIPVQDASLFAVGNTVVLRTDLTQGFIDEHGMTGKWTALAAEPKAVVYCRRVTDVDLANNTLTIDVPTRYFLKLRDNPRVARLSKMLNEVGIEDLSIGMAATTKSGFGEEDWQVSGTAAYDLHQSNLIFMETGENCWIRRVNSYSPPGNTTGHHVLSNGIRLSRCRNVTVVNCDMRKSQYRGGGGNGYLYILAGNDCLIKDSYAEAGRHNYDFQTMACSGNVLTNCTTVSGSLPTDFHMYLSQANLLDTMNVDRDYLEARYREVASPLHGVTATQTVFWNTNGIAYKSGKTFIVDDREFAKGYTIGTRGPASAVTGNLWKEGIGNGANLVPQSLYQDQVTRRIYPITNVTVASGQNYPVVNYLGVGSKTYLESWDTATYTTVPAEFLGLTYIRTSRGDATRTESSFLTGTAGGPVTIYVAYRAGYTVPSWLSTWQDTGKNLVTSSNMTMRVRKKQFPAGTITLGGNQAGGGTSTMMYTVLAGY